MSFKDKLARASKRTRDVRVLINGQLITEREELVREVNLAKGKDPLWASDPTQEAQAALDAFDEQIRDEFIWIRVPELPRATWHAIQNANPLPPREERTELDRQNGCDVLGVTADVILGHGRIVEDGEPIDVPDEDMQALVEEINAGDFVRLAVAVMQLNEGTAFENYRALGNV